MDHPQQQQQQQQEYSFVEEVRPSPFGDPNAPLRPPRKLVLRVTPPRAVLLVRPPQAAEGGETVEREVPLSVLQGWGSTNLGIDLHFGDAMPRMFFPTNQANAISDVLLRTLALMRDEQERTREGSPSSPVEGARETSGEDQGPRVTVSIETIRPVPPYTGSAK